MKKILFAAVCIAAVSSVTAQTKTPPKTPPKTVARSVAQTPILKTRLDSVSYVMGEIAAFGLINQGLGDVKMNTVAFNRALTDVLGKKQTMISDVAANALMNRFMSELQQEKVKPTIEAGRKFLAENKTKPNVKTTASGLQYQVLTEGTGIKPTMVDTFVVHYRGTLLDGTEFDASYNRGQPLTYPMTNVISGWSEALQLMSVGSRYKVWIPFEIGYGVMGQGQIPGGAVLVFEMELLDVKKKAE